MKEKRQICGIYKITNLINGKSYVGQSINITGHNGRWHQHIYNNTDSIIHKAIVKYGKENFSFEIIEECPIDQLNEREIYWIDYYNTYKEGYNCTYGGDTGRRYDYNEIFELWQSGLACKEIEAMLECDDATVTKALRYYNISEEQIRNRINNKNQYVAVDIDTGMPLKIFSGARAVMNFFNGKFTGVTSLGRIADKKQRIYGYYWEMLTENNVPAKELSDEEFLSYQKEKTKNYTKEQKLAISMAQRKVERPSREELKRLIRELPFTQIGKKYGVSDNAIRKWCNVEDLPYKKSEIKAYSDEEWELI